MLRWLRASRAPTPTARTDADWLDGLRRRDAETLAALRVVLLAALRPVLRERAPAHADALAEDLAQDATLHLLGRLDAFHGDARFTTWAARVAVRLALSELRRLRWRDVSLDALLEAAPAALPAGDADADHALLTADAQALLRALVAEVLTERQRTAMQAVMVHGMPLDEVARRMGTNRNALYKLLHDARLRLRRALEARGLGPDDLFPDA